MLLSSEKILSFLKLQNKQTFAFFIYLQCGKFKYTTARITSRDFRSTGCFAETPSSFCELITSTDNRTFEIIDYQFENLLEKLVSLLDMILPDERELVRQLVAVRAQLFNKHLPELKPCTVTRGNQYSSASSAVTFQWKNIKS